MPKYLESIQGVRESFRRPVVTEVIRDVMRWTGINTENTRIQFPGEFENTFQPGSTVDNQGAFNQFESQRTVSLSVNEEVLEDSVLSISAYNRDHAEIFYDPDSRVYARPIYSPCMYSISITYRAVDVVDAERWRDEIIARVATYREYLIHQPKYSYVFPDVYMGVLEYVHQLRESGPKPYGETLPEYISKHMTSRASILTTAAGTEGRWAVSESQTRVVGWFDFGGVPEKPERHNETSAHNITINYKFQIERPTAVVMELPIVINNQVLDESFRQKAKHYTIPEVVSHASRSNIAMGIFESGERVRYFQQKDHGIKIPDYIEFLPRVTPPSTRNICLMLSTIDTSNPGLLMRLDQLGEWSFSELILEFMREEAPWMHAFGKSIFNVSVYRNQNMINEKHVRLDNSLNIMLLEDPDTRDIHHIRLSIVEDLSLLDKAALDRLRANAAVARELLNIIIPTGDEAFSGSGYAGGLTDKQRDRVKNGLDVGRHGIDWPAVQGSTWKPTSGRESNQMLLVGKLYNVVPSKPSRVLPWDGVSDTKPGSSSNGSLSRFDFNKIVDRSNIGKKPSVVGENNWAMELSNRRVMGLFVQTERAAGKENPSVTGVH